jgi:hypothetical protein
MKLYGRIPMREMTEAEVGKLQGKECGVTDISLAAARRLFASFGVPTEIKVMSGKVAARFTDADGCRFTYVFGGFSWGYMGEGPRGFETFLRMCGIPITPQTNPTNPKSRWGDWNRKDSDNPPSPLVRVGWDGTML